MGKQRKLQFALPLRVALQIYESLSLFATGLTGITVFLYVAGNFQEFADTTQLMLLSLMRGLSGVVVVAVFLLVPAEIVLLIRRFQTRRIIAVLSWICVFILALIVLIFSSAVLVFRQPL